LTNDAPADVKHAAALILLTPRGRLAEAAGAATADNYFIPLTIRRPDLLHHPGQISLPGGGLDHGEMHEAAALREAEEEIGVDPSTVRILGALTPLYVIVSGYVVAPFVGVVDARPEFRPEAREVAEIIEVPLGVLLDPARRMRGTKTREGYKLDFPYFAVGDEAQHQVWGATAMILSEFAELVTETTA
jgi:8-oxo-dGTP pyrophosphatase MutT (NUDIX family)